MHPALRLLTPWILISEVPSPCIFAPMERIYLQSQIVLENPPEGELKAFLEVYRKMGGQYKGNSGKLLVNGKNVQSPVKLLETGVYPGFPTDLQSPSALRSWQICSYPRCTKGYRNNNI